MKTSDTGANGRSAPEVLAQRLAAEIEAAIADLEQRFAAGIGPVERALAEAIRGAVARLMECSARLVEDGIVVSGSQGQPRPNPLLTIERELRREVASSLRALAHQAEQRAVFERARALTRRRSRRSQEADATSTAKEPRQ